MEIPESLIMELCNTQRTIGQLEERLSWLRSSLKTSGRISRPFIETQINSVDNSLCTERERAARLMREMYGEDVQVREPGKPDRRGTQESKRRLADKSRRG